MRFVPRGKKKPDTGVHPAFSLRKPVGCRHPEGGTLYENVPPRILTGLVVESILERECQALRWDRGDAAA